MSSKHSPEKWPRHKNAYDEWWNSLSHDDKMKFKKHFEKVREWNSKRKGYQYPDMYDTTQLRVNKLSDKHIYRIWVFRDHPEDRPL